MWIYPKGGRNEICSCYTFVINQKKHWIMKKIISILSLCLITVSQAQTVIYEQNFDSLTVGTSLMNQITTGEWETWDNTIGGTNDPFISNSESLSGNNSLHITEGKDVVYKLGNVKNGHYEVEFDFFHTPGKKLYFNVEHQKAVNYISEIIFYNDSVFVKEMDSNKISQSYYFEGTYNSTAWNHVKMDIDLDEEVFTLYVNSINTYSCPMHYTLNNIPSIYVDVINFFGADSITDNYIDNFKVGSFKENANVALDVSSSLNFDNNSTGTAELTNSDVATVKYEASVQFDHHVWFDQGPIIHKEILAYDSVAHVSFRTLNTSQANHFNKYSEDEMSEFLGLTLDSIKPDFHAQLGDTIGTANFIIGSQNSTIHHLSFDSVHTYSKSLNAWYSRNMVYNIGDYTYNGGEIYAGIQALDYDTFHVYCSRVENRPIYRTSESFSYKNENYLIRQNLYFSGQKWPRWLSIVNPIGQIEEGASVDLEMNFDLSLLEINNEYTATVRVKSNDEINGIQMIPVSLDYNNISVDEQEINVGVLAYPNPTTDLVQLQANREMKSVEIFNIKGQSVNIEVINNLKTQIDLSTYPSGQYILKINFEGGQLEKSIIKQ